MDETDSGDIGHIAPETTSSVDKHEISVGQGLIRPTTMGRRSILYHPLGLR
jgi:hypothetical protein